MISGLGGVVIFCAAELFRQSFLKQVPHDFGAAGMILSLDHEGGRRAGTVVS